MRISELYSTPERAGLFYRETVYVIGLGPSLKCYPKDFFYGKICLFLNNAYTLVSPTGCAAIAFLNHDSFWKEDPIPEWVDTRICRGRFGKYPNPERDDNMTPWDSKEFYVFSYKHLTHDDGRNLTTFNELWREPDHYWCNSGGTVAVFALQFAALAGFREIFLVGCDCTNFAARHYAASHIQRDREKRLFMRPEGLDGRDYDPYREGLETMQREIWRNFRVPVVSLSPFMGIGAEQKQFKGFSQFRSD